MRQTRFGIEVDMPSAQDKAARLQQATSKAQAFLDAGGDLNSQAAVPFGLELIHAFNDLASDFGGPILESIERAETLQED